MKRGILHYTIFQLLLDISFIVLRKWQLFLIQPLKCGYLILSFQKQMMYIDINIYTYINKNFKILKCMYTYTHTHMHAHMIDFWVIFKYIHTDFMYLLETKDIIQLPLSLYFSTFSLDVHSCFWFPLGSFILITYPMLNCRSCCPSRTFFKAYTRVISTIRHILSHCGKEEKKWGEYSPFN